MSKSTVTGEVTSVALLTDPGSDKNTCYLSSFIWALQQLQLQVGQDFTLQDGIAVCAALTCFCNIQVLVSVMVGGDCASLWRERHERPVGALGLLFELSRKKNGGINNGRGFTRRYQPFAYGDQKGSRYVNLIQVALSECSRSRHRRCTEAVYEELIKKFQKAMGSTENLLSIQTFVQGLHMAGFLPVEGLHRYGIINPKNSNQKSIVRYLANTKGAAKKARLAAMQEQNTMYLSALLQTDFDTNLLENNTCEAIRFKKLQEYQKNPKDNNAPIQATDMYFPGQTYYETWEIGRAHV